MDTDIVSRYTGKRKNDATEPAPVPNQDAIMATLESTTLLQTTQPNHPETITTDQDTALPNYPNQEKQ